MADGGFGRRVLSVRAQVEVSREDLAADVGISCKWLGQVERGESRVRLEDARLIVRALAKRMPDLNALWLLIGDTIEPPVRSSRRDFLGSGVRTLPAMFMPIPPPGGASPSHRTFEARGGPRPLDPAEVEGWERLTETFAMLRPIQPPDELLEVLATHLSVLRSRVDERHGAGDLWRRLLAVTGRTAVLAAWTAFMADRLDVCRDVVRQAEDLAEEAGDLDAMLVVLMLRSDLLSAVPLGGVGGLPAQARQHLERALAMTSPATPLALRGPLLLRLAEERAFARQERETLELLDAAREAEANSGPRTHSLRPAWGQPGMALGATNGFTGNCLQMLGRTREALNLMESISPTLLRNDNAHNRIDRAAAHARQQEPERAGQLLAEALAIAMSTGRTIGVRRIHGVRSQLLERWANERTVKDLDEQLAAIL